MGVLRQDMTVMRQEFRANMTAMRSEFRADMTAMRTEIKDDMRMNKWKRLGIVLALPTLAASIYVTP
jgi:hypothetical protein